VGQNCPSLSHRTGRQFRERDRNYPLNARGCVVDAGENSLVVREYDRARRRSGEHSAAGAETMSRTGGTRACAARSGGGEPAG
jgi:hypothetical protein